MKKHKKLFAAVLVAMLVLTFAAPALAVPSAEEQAANGHTTIGIYETTVDPALISFEVPLYVTMAAVQGETAVRVPTNYGIKNNSAATNLGVTGVEFGTVAGGNWSTVAHTGTPTGKQVKLTIGNIEIPGLGAGLGSLQSMTLTGSVFANADKAAVILPGATLNVPLEGEISATAVSAEASAVPQFRVKYTVAAVNTGGDPTVADPYVGNDSNLAGFGTWDSGTGGFTP